MIIVSGDLVKHDFDYGKNKELKNAKEKLEEMMGMMKDVFDVIFDNFPQTPLVFTFGNNDNIKNYQPPPFDSKDGTNVSQLTEEYFERFFDMIYGPESKSKVNYSPAQLREMKRTFLKGGYYQYDVDDKLSILALNTIYFSQGNKQNIEEGGLAD